ncbi:MAG TPA: DUF2177 family protein [Bacillota bacterium]|nr:DUF2177 family protein [Bacillota bacterium]HPF42526.1 DUF2177 family protein [Bacillota bacterium]HPJ86000.1 DUF2177 family protein [Bacillota bacterium]HPQ61979.1 DUF2177 family protein [Bacillota bacterium]HRX92121.1 DUF2177 family protein [Candidatus Izemoplasmatales bacterium]
MTYLKLYAIALGFFLVIDMLWLGVVAKKVYDRYLGGYIGKVKWIPAIIFYLVFVAGLVFFVIYPAVGRESLNYAIYASMFFGFVAYSTYDLTNMATLKDWPWQIVLIDIAWGMILGGIVSTVTYLIAR